MGNAQPTEIQPEAERDFRQGDAASDLQQPGPEETDATRQTSKPINIRRAGSWNNGVYVMGLVQANGHTIPVHFLVDTGAAVSAMSLTTYDRLPQETRPPLKSTDVQLAGVAGDSLDIAGAAKMTLVFNGIVIMHDILIMDVPVEAILGQDILLEHQGKVDLSNLTLKLQNTLLPCWVASGNAMTTRVVVHQKTSVPAWSEKMVPMRVMNQGYLAESGYIQPYPDTITSKGPLVIPGILPTHDQVICVWVANFGDKDAVLYSMMNIATCQSVYVSDTAEESHPGIFAIHRTSSNVEGQLQDLVNSNSEHLSENEKVEFSKLLRKYHSIFATSKKDLGRASLVKHCINTGTALPVQKPPRRIPLGKRQIEKEEIKAMLDRGVIQPSTSPWASPVVLVMKKDGSTRFCVDYRGLNDLTVKDAYPLPRIDDSLDALNGGRWFNTMDLMSGYWQIMMDPADVEKTAFATSQGPYEFRVMAFGLANAPGTFERLMESVLRGLQWEECLVYMDDIIVAGTTVIQCLERLDHLFERLHAAGLKLKCTFFHKSVKFLGHVVTADGVHTDPEKIQHVKEWPVPKTVKEVRSFLGFCSYYRKFIAGFAQIARPLHKLT